MIGALLLAATLAAAPAPEPAPAASSPLDEKITLELKDASLVDTLEKLAFLLDATPIFEPGMERMTLTVKVTDSPVRQVISMIERGSLVKIRYEEKGGKRFLFVSRVAGGPAPALAASTPAASPAAYEFRTARGASTSWTASERLASIEIPDCRAPVRVVQLRPDDGGRLVVIDESGQARIVRPSRPEAPAGSFTLFGCRQPISLLAADERGGAPAPAEPPASTVQFLTIVKLLEISPDGEEVLTTARLVSTAGGTFRMGSGCPSADTAGCDIRISGLLAETGPQEALLALSVTVDRDLEPARNRARLAESDQVVRLALGKAERVTLSSTYGGGRSALVAELTVTRVERK